jgi:hypothetical protein
MTPVKSTPTAETTAGSASWPVGPDPEQIDAALRSLGKLVEADGARVNLVGRDQETGTLTIGLDLSAVPCADCVISPHQLSQLLIDQLHQTLGDDVPVRIEDPRLLDSTLPAVHVPLATVTVLDPTGELPPGTARYWGSAAGGHHIDSLEGKVIGFRRDVYWISWNWVAEEWAAMAESEGASARWWRHRPPVGEDVQALKAGLSAFVDEIDLGVFGMCNCGACTMWTVEEALGSIAAGNQTVVVATEHFADLARSLSIREGFDGLLIKTLPFPLEGLPESEVRQIAREHYPSLVAMLKDSVPV